MTPYVDITSKTNRFVKGCALVAACFTTFLVGTGDFSSVNAQEEPPQEEISEETVPEETVPESALPPIEARVYQVSVHRISDSMRVYLFNDTRDIKPRVGKIILLRSDNLNVMAFRVVRTYTKRNQFAGVQVRKYDDIHVLEMGPAYRVIEKIADLTPTPQGEETFGTEDDLDQLEESEGIPQGEPGESEFDGDVGEDTAQENPEEPTGEASAAGDSIEDDFSEEDAESKALAFDPDLDEPPTPSEVEELEGLDVDELYSADKYVIKPKVKYEKYKNWFSAEFFSFLAAGKTFSSFGARYATNIGQSLFMNPGSSLQDVLSFEFGLFTYSASAVFAADDTYSVIPIVSTLRYNLFASESFSFNFYGGLLFNLLLSSQNATSAGTSAFSGFGIAMGGGIVFRFGPQWFLRLEGGLDGFGGGLVIRF